MVKELRKKFVIITMSLKCLLLGALYIANHCYRIYLLEQDTRQMVRWFTQSNILINEKNADIGIEMIENTFEYESGLSRAI